MATSRSTVFTYTRYSAFTIFLNNNEKLYSPHCPEIIVAIYLK